MRKYYTNSQGPDEAAMRAGLAATLQIALESTVPRAVLALRAKKHLDNYHELLTQDQIRLLKTEGHAEIEGVECVLHTPQSHRGIRVSAPVLALLSPSQLLHELEADPATAALVYVPWMPEELAEFLRRSPDAVRIGDG